MKLTIWTYVGGPLESPGTSLWAPGTSLWAYVLLRDDVRVHYDSGCESTGTEHAPALRAVTMALARTGIGSVVTVYCESKYVVCNASNWSYNMKRGVRLPRREPIADVPLWEQLVSLVNRRHVEFKWGCPGRRNPAHDAWIEAARRAA